MSEGMKIGLLGLGTIGYGVARVLQEKRDSVAAQVGRPVVVSKALVRNPEKPRPTDIPAEVLTHNPAEVLDDPEIGIIVEALGGEDPAYAYLRRAIKNGKHVSTANKEVMAKHGPELYRLAAEHGVDLYCEASVGGGIPLIGPFRYALNANGIQQVMAIINGTTNYILTKMAEEGLEFDIALRQAQELGYAEPDPTNDVEGIDSTYKLTILSSLAFHSVIKPEDIYREGISSLSAADFRYAHEMGYVIKLLAIAKQTDGQIEVRVHPTFVPRHWLIGQVRVNFNAVSVTGDLVGEVMFYGQGAGANPTASAIVSDIIDLAQNALKGTSNRPAITFSQDPKLRPMDDVQTRYYLRLQAADQPGALAAIAGVLGEQSISIASVVQKEVDAQKGQAEVVIVTHLAREASMRKALTTLRALPAIKGIGGFVRIEG
ncbi:MAG: homoserine dehydrogenase [Chloroflexi bacterium]|nr:homoserine dehydrogenase [Chloroflexota bacterium]